LGRVPQGEEMPIEALAHGRVLGELAMHLAALVDHCSQLSGTGFAPLRLQDSLTKLLCRICTRSHSFRASMSEGGGAARLVAAHIATVGLSIGKLK